MTAPTQLPLDLPTRVARGREDFLVAACNEDAVAWIDRWPDWPGHALALYGPPGCGKTHLAHVWSQRSGAAILSSHALEGASMQRGLGTGVVVEHDGGPFDEAALFHLYNALGEAGGDMLLTGSVAPSRWPVGLADLRSRLRAATAVQIGEPDDALLAAVLVKLFADRQVRVGRDVVAYIAARLERSFDAARRCVALIDERALEGARPVTVRLAAQVLAELLPVSQPGLFEERPLGS